MRSTDPDARLRTAVEFANRAGMAQDDDAIQEIEEALKDPDPLVREVAALTAIQLHKFRALRIADLDVAHRSTQKLAQIKFPAASRPGRDSRETCTGFVTTEAGSEERDNARSRMVALLRLVEWHTGEAQKALRAAAVRSRPEYRQGRGTCPGSFPAEWRTGR